MYTYLFKNIIIIKNILQNTWTKPLYNCHHRPLFCFFFLTGISALSVTIYLLSEQIIKKVNTRESETAPKESWTLNFKEILHFYSTHELSTEIIILLLSVVQTFFSNYPLEILKYTPKCSRMLTSNNNNNLKSLFHELTPYIQTFSWPFCHKMANCQNGELRKSTI